MSRLEHFQPDETPQRRPPGPGLQGALWMEIEPRYGPGRPRPMGGGDGRPSRA